MRGLILVAWNGVCFFYYLGTDRGHGEMARTTRQDRMVLDALWSDPTESDEVLGVHVRNSVSEVLGIQDVVSQCQSGVSSWEEYMPFWTWQSEGGKRFEERKVQYSKCVPVCTVSGLILVAPASCRNSTRETLWNSSSVLTNVPDAQMWPAYWGWSLATPPGPFSQKLFRRKHPVKILLTRVGDRMIQRFTPDSVQKILKYALRVEVQHGYEYFAAGQLLTVFSVRIPAMQIWWTNRNRQWIEATNYCNQHDNDGAMIVLVKARKRNTWAPHDTSRSTSRCCTTNSVRRMNAPEIWLSMPKSSGVATCGVPKKLPAKHRRHCHLAQVDTSYGWNDQQFRALDLGLFASCCSVLFVYTTVVPLLYTSTVVKKLSFHQKKDKIPLKSAWGLHLWDGRVAIDETVKFSWICTNALARVFWPTNSQSYHLWYDVAMLELKENCAGVVSIFMLYFKCSKIVL